MEIQAITLSPKEKYRFWSKAKLDGECLVWKGTINKDGYGVFTFRKRKYPAHRFALMLVDKTFPEVGLHNCDNRPCINPKHLSSGTADENRRDMVRKRRHNPFGRKGRPKQERFWS